MVSLATTEVKVSIHFYTKRENRPLQKTKYSAKFNQI